MIIAKKPTHIKK